MVQKVVQKMVSGGPKSGPKRVQKVVRKGPKSGQKVVRFPTPKSAHFGVWKSRITFEKSYGLWRRTVQNLS